MSALRGEALRFLAAGMANTAATYAVYLVLLAPLGYGLAYSVAFASGIALSYLLGTRFVFRVSGSLRRAMAFPLVYFAQYLAGLGVLHIGVAWLSVPTRLALLASIAVTVPLTFALSRLLLKRCHERMKDQGVG